MQRSRFIAVGALGVLSAAMGLLMLDAGGRAEKRTPLAPKLEVHAKNCSARAEVAFDRARDARSSALARIAHYPFDPRDGVTAARLLDEAALCLASVGEAPLSDETRTLESRFVARLENDYRTRRLRLDIALARGDVVVAAREAHRLSRLLDGVTDDYTEWLSETERRLGEPGGVP
jgi:hypothetical protein